jgi:protein O-GlcNAc transferase
MTARQAYDLYPRRPMAEAAALCERLVVDRPPSRPGTCWARRGWAGPGRRGLAALDRALALDPVRPASCRPGPWPGRPGRDDEALAPRRGPGGRSGQSACAQRLGRGLAPSGPPGEALAAYDAAWRSRPGFVDALCNRGVALSDLGRFEQALAAHDAPAPPRRATPGPGQPRGAAVAAERPGRGGAGPGSACSSWIPAIPASLGDLMWARRQSATGATTRRWTCWSRPT